MTPVTVRPMPAILPYGSPRGCLPMPRLPPDTLVAVGIATPYRREWLRVVVECDAPEPPFTQPAVVTSHG